MGAETGADGLLVALLLVGKAGDDMKGVEPSLGGASHIDDLAV